MGILPINSGNANDDGVVTILTFPHPVGETPQDDKEDSTEDPVSILPAPEKVDDAAGMPESNSTEAPVATPVSIILIPQAENNGMPESKLIKAPVAGAPVSIAPKEEDILQLNLTKAPVSAPAVVIVPAPPGKSTRLPLKVTTAPVLPSSLLIEELADAAPDTAKSQRDESGVYVKPAWFDYLKSQYGRPGKRCAWLQNEAPADGSFCPQLIVKGKDTKTRELYNFLEDCL